jgi:hypothetical protein
MALGALQTCFVMMFFLLDMSADPRRIVEVLDADFLCAVVRTASLDPQKHTRLKNFLKVQLPRALVYRSVVSTLKRALHAAEQFTTTDEFRASAIFDDWCQFVQLAEDRIRVLKYVSRRTMSPRLAVEI